MGTSTSRRSPTGSMRWRVARTLLAGNDATRTAQQLLTAAGGDTWATMMRSPALHEMARVAGDGLGAGAGVGGAGGMLAEGGAVPVEEAVGRAVDDARHRALRTGGGGILLALAERSLSRVLLEQATAGDPQARADLTPEQGTSAFFRETLRQLLLHLAARDLPGVDPTLTARDARRRTRDVAEAGVLAAERAANLVRERGDAGWDEAVNLVFGVARADGR